LINLSNISEGILEKLDEGEGTLGRLLTDDSVYNKIEDMIEDIKSHPWKLLHRPSKRDEDKGEGNRGYIYERNQKPESSD